MDWANLIGTLGFPIVAALGAAWFIYHVWTNEQQENKAREEKMFELTRELSSNLAELGRIVDENTKIIAVMKQDLDDIKNKINNK